MVRVGVRVGLGLVLGLGLGRNNGLSDQWEFFRTLRGRTDGALKGNNRSVYVLNRKNWSGERIKSLRVASRI